ncbi:MAG: hypothetical protein AB9856_11725 [Cellulosilyticaceae bacterium]
MIDEKKIILMTKLAVQDKRYGREDKRITSYYKEDYRYINNFWTRVSLCIVVGFFIVLDLFSKIEEGAVIPDSMRKIIELYLLPYGLIIISVLVVYTLISTVVFSNKYAKAQKRMNEYHHNLKKLDEYEEQLLNEEGGKNDTK